LRYEIRLMNKIPASRIRAIQTNVFCLDSELSKTLAPQNPPSPEAKSTKPLAEEDPGVELRTPLRMTRVAKTKEIRSAGDFLPTASFLATRQVAPRDRTHNNPENRLARSPGINTT
jgi:hypothetical protein